MGMFAKIFKKGEPKGDLENMVRIVKEYRGKFEGDLGGELYIKGSIPPHLIESTINLLSKLLPDATKIDENEVVAIFLSCEQGQQKCFSTLLFTVNGFYYDMGGKEGTPGFVRWSRITNVVRRINLSSDIRKEIKFEFYGGEREGSIFMPAKYVHSVNHFLIPVLKKLSDSVGKMEVFEDEKTSIKEKVKTLYKVVKYNPIPELPPHDQIPRVLHGDRYITEAEYNIIMAEEEKENRIERIARREEYIASITRRFENHKEILEVINRLSEEHKDDVIDFLLSLRKKQRDEFDWEEYKNLILAREDANFLKSAKN